MSKTTKLIAYYRVSTPRQGVSGLGLEAQRAAVTAYAAMTSSTLVAEFTEIESGKKVQRPELTRALHQCRANGAILVIAKLDRLARNVAFLSALMETDIEFRAMDLPGASRLYLHVMAAVAEHEALAISERTKAALQAAKARGMKFGSAAPNGRSFTAAAGARGRKAIRAALDAHARPILPLLRQWRRAGWTRKEMAAGLAFHGFQTARGGPWSDRRVRSMLGRLKKRRARAQRRRNAIRGQSAATIPEVLDVRKKDEQGALPTAVPPAVTASSSGGSLAHAAKQRSTLPK